MRKFYSNSYLTFGISNLCENNSISIQIKSKMFCRCLSWEKVFQFFLAPVLSILCCSLSFVNGPGADLGSNRRLSLKNELTFTCGGRMEIIKVLTR